jgi:hypothetical protein
MTGLTHTVYKEMGYSRPDFLRLLPKALDGKGVQAAEDRFEVDDGGRRLIVEIGPESERRLGNFRLPRLPITLSFSNYSEQEMETALRRFWQTYQKGGG